MTTTEEEVREAAWNGCKKYDASGARRDTVLLENYVSAHIEALFGERTENEYRAEWRAEMIAFVYKYGGYA